jgi:hypothetical protein
VAAFLFLKNNATAFVAAFLFLKNSATIQKRTIDGRY